MVVAKRMVPIHRGPVARVMVTIYNCAAVLHLHPASYQSTSPTKASRIVVFQVLLKSHLGGTPVTMEAPATENIEPEKRYLLRIVRSVSHDLALECSGAKNNRPDYSGESDLSNATLFLGGGQNLLLRPSSAGTAERSVVVKRGQAQGQSTLVIDGPSASGEFLILQGPSGKGEHRLRASSRVTPFGIGSAICHDSWEAARDAAEQKLLLRYANENFGDRSWVAVPPREPGSGDDAWEVWWYEPLPFNAKDLPGAVAVDVELVPVW
ncbi:hypothetical protein CTA2_3623 [Colletotrichum tanaceti]|uniref:Uncharacterized protein n=1 Tax=Colletotrichum tanaceti TaxID=1306861 RepID=A0A4U6XR24_9PEZI|nr:hypothetical protein CTA2_3623 [Colletotrichum tanaceti]TKW58310.1 hypothetical protein CTA1_12134 [Colletotrichum tanaceti]